MIDLSCWPATTVGDFFSALPWHGKVAQLTQAKVSEPIDWRLLSVQDFFGNMSWDGRQTQPETAWAAIPNSKS